MPSFRRAVRTVALALPAAAVLTVVAPAVASVAATTTTGVRCTIIGTGHADHLEGTAGRDVICGLGGNDTIDGLGGNDVIDAGSGNDTVTGGSGNDTLSGGSGKDEISGGSGTDTEYGGTGDDEIYGGSGADLILGQSGNDDLNGQSGGDSLNGGSGTDWCTIGAGDSEKSCVYDRTAPSIDLASITLSERSIDVTKADRQVRVSVHLRDDTGVARPYAALYSGDQYTPNAPMQLTSGTVRDGVWTGPITVHRYAVPGSFYLGFDVTDRVGRGASDTDPQKLLTVKDATPDTQAPVVRSVSVPSAAIDTRSADNSITFTAHITDDAAGVRNPVACIYAPGAPPEWVQTRCVGMTRSKGVPADGTWKATAPLPKASIGGTWNVGVWVQDVLGTGGMRYYLGSDIYHWQQTRNAPYPNPAEIELPGARFSVLGSTDTHPPRLRTVKVNRTSLDTLAADQTVEMYVHTQDAKGEGVTDLQIYVDALDPANADVRPQQITAATLYQGDAVDGWWKVELVFPRGMPPGQYRLNYVSVRDRLHDAFYAAVPQTGGIPEQPYPAGSLLTTSGGAWDGVFTVVANPAG